MIKNNIDILCRCSDDYLYKTSINGIYPFSMSEWEIGDDTIQQLYYENYTALLSTIYSVER